MLGWGYAQNTKILFWAEDIAQIPSLFVVFGYNNCSVSNPNVTRYTKTRLTSQNFILRKTTKWKNDCAHEDDIFTSTYAQMYREHSGAFGLAPEFTVYKLRRKKRRSLEIEMYYGKGA